MSKPSLAVWKFASCDGCQLSILGLEDHLLDIVGAIEIAYFPEATRAEVAGPYTISMVEGSITTPHDAERIQEIRRQSEVVITIGACATSGGIQALRNWADVKAFTDIVYAHPEYISTLDTSTPIEDHIKVDLEMRGCPISQKQLLEVITAFVAGRRPDLPRHSVCEECKLRGTHCIMVSKGIPCLGPVTQAGCGAICPAYDRGCYGCFGPCEGANVEPLADAWLEMGVKPAGVVRALRSFNGYAPEFREASEKYARA